MITYQVESLTKAKDEFHQLFVMHWEEIARHKDTIKLNIDYDTYSKMEDIGVLQVATARDSGKLVAYIASIVTPNLHYCDHLMANNDVLYVHPEYRGSSIFVKLLQFTEDYLEDIGVVNFYIHMKLAHDFGPVLERRGYSEIERNFEKILRS